MNTWHWHLIPKSYMWSKSFFYHLHTASNHDTNMNALHQKLSEGGGSVVVGSLLIVTPIVVLCNCSMFCCVLLFLHSSFAIILMGKRELVALLCLSSWCLVIVVLLFLTMPWVCLQFVIVVFPDHTHLLFLALLAIKHIQGNLTLILDSTVLTQNLCYLHTLSSNSTKYEYFP